MTSYFLASFTCAKVGEALVWYKGLLVGRRLWFGIRGCWPIQRAPLSCVRLRLSGLVWYKGLLADPASSVVFRLSELRVRTSSCADVSFSSSADFSSTAMVLDTSVIKESRATDAACSSLLNVSALDSARFPDQRASAAGASSRELNLVEAGVLPFSGSISDLWGQRTSSRRDSALTVPNTGSCSDASATSGRFPSHCIRKHVGESRTFSLISASWFIFPLASTIVQNGFHLLLMCDNSPYPHLSLKD